jgi:hypothetical protein
MLPNLLPILEARKYTLIQHSPGKQQFAPLAQLAEQVTLNHWVAGSIPARCTKLLSPRISAQSAFCGPSQRRGWLLSIPVRLAPACIRLGQRGAAPSALFSRRIRAR